MESEPGVRLFDRHTGGVTTTAAGRDIVAEARRALRQADRIRVLAERHRQWGARVPRVGFEAGSTGGLSARARGGFARRRPGVRGEPKRLD
ncbi:hypothetical protein ACFYPB_05020 [Streptomyces olivaceoviridis]|uniref:hypothetical protein n=1 Tax=Streptomyces olivaceoviridis TaxID=1921 RepID=UPI0036A5D08C